MAIANLPTPVREIEYPDSDGKPMSDNTKQFRWIVTIEGGLDTLFESDPNVFVAGDLLWYPVEGNNTIRAAPDAMVVFGRPKGDRGSYKQWLEEQIAPQVVFEILSPGNTLAEMTRKFQFYERHGVQEYYVYDPDSGELAGWQRANGWLEEIPVMSGWASPRLGIRFELNAGELEIYRPDGERFKTFNELAQAEQEARVLAAYARTQAEQERERANQERERAERLAAQLRALGVEPE